MEEVTNFFGQVMRPTKRSQESIDALRKHLRIQELASAAAMTMGYKFMFKIHAPRNGVLPRSLDTFASRDFRFVFIPNEPRGLTPMRLFANCHEFGHMTILSVLNYFSSESLIRVMLPLPLLAACISPTKEAAIILAAIIVGYIYLSRYFYPSRMWMSSLRDEVCADRWGVHLLPTSLAEQINGEALRAFAGSDPRLKPEGWLPEPGQDLNEIEEYRLSLIKDEISHKKAGGTFTFSYLAGARMDRAGRVIGGHGSPAEGVLGMGMAALAFRSYHLSNYSLPIALGMSAAFLLIYFLGVYAVWRSFRKLCERLKPLQFIAPTS